MFGINPQWFNDTINTFKAFGWRDALDIMVLAFIIYQAVKLVRETRAVQLLKGILVLFLFYFLSDTLELRTMRFLTDNVLQVGLFALLVVFQPELRRALERVGRAKFSGVPMLGRVLSEQERQAEWMQFIAATLSEIPVLSKKKTGALLVVEQETKLGEIVKTGTTVDAAASAELIGNLFFTNSPLHDGAVIVRDGRILAAGCFLPLTEDNQLSKELGTRHRAALGVSEMSDALVIVVSEETGTISLCQNGKMRRGITMEVLEETLMTVLLGEHGNEKTQAKRQSKRKKRKSKSAAPNHPPVQEPLKAKQGDTSAKEEGNHE